MACFIVPAVEAVAVTAAFVAAKKHEQKITAPAHERGEIGEKDVKITWSKRLSWLMALLWGGVLLLAFEHFWHGEVVPFPPFLTAMASPEDTAEMLHEMATVGVSMAVTVTAFWGVMCAIAQAKVKKIKASVAKEN
ncbi:MAG: hypothetical protein K5755_05520 [Clostridiales bacterium]|nr:hypothetical protein [Clostridia bacterium]MCR4564075.1 hypothetical protein [Clostridiales bacterium]